MVRFATRILNLNVSPTLRDQGQECMDLYLHDFTFKNAGLLSSCTKQVTRTLAFLYQVACMHACMYVCMYVCMYACMHACTHTQISATQCDVFLFRARADNVTGSNQLVPMRCRKRKWRIITKQGPTAQRQVS